MMMMMMMIIIIIIIMNPRYRICAKVEEAITHIISGCLELAKKSTSWAQQVSGIHSLEYL